MAQPDPQASDLADRFTPLTAARYRIERELGQGGMATVYLAQDLKHHRQVAIKVLHAELSAVLGPERFLKEIELTANLQHPHILPLFDSGSANGLLYYVMPFVDGESLRDRLAREQYLPIPDAVRIATEVADALQYAHERGVIHRDIKPENILLQTGHALVADFGIALAVQHAGGQRMTQTGLSLGTPQYMSPEQAMGEREISAKSDIYSLGAVTYEMLAGEPPFTGPNAQAIVAKVMTEKPAPLAARRDRVSPAVDDAVLTALAKLPADRFASASEFATALHGSAVATPARRASRRQSSSWSRGAVVIAAVFAALAAWGWLRPRPEAQTELTYLSFGDSVRVQTDNTAGVPLAISPDGKLLVVVGDTLRRLWLKRTDSPDPVLLAGTQHATSPTFSPDGKWIAYIADAHLQKVSVDGGPSITVADSAGDAFGVAWLDDGTLVFTDVAELGLRRVSANGGAVTIVTQDTLFHGESPLLATPLPGARGVLFQLCASSCVTTALHAIDLRTGRQKVLLDNVLMGWYVADRYLIYLRPDGVLLAAPFDPATLEIRGASVPVLQGVGFNGVQSFLAVSRSGTLVYAGGAWTSNVTLQHQNATGAAVPFDSTWIGIFNSFALAPDGKRAAVGVSTPDGGTDIWIKQLDRGPFTRLTRSRRDRRPAWSPNGREIAFIRDSASGGDVYARDADGGGAERRLVHLSRALQEVTWSHDGRWIFVRTETSAPGGGDIVAVHANGDTDVVAVAATPVGELEPAPSPDGRWVAFVVASGLGGDVFVRPFPNSAAASWQISTNGGGSPAWSPDGKKLYFIDATGHLIMATIAPGPEFRVSALTPRFGATRFSNGVFHQSFAIAPDGEFVFLGPVGSVSSSTDHVVRITGWFRDLAAKVKR